MTKTYNARPGTRITASAGAQRQPALDRRRRLSHVLAGVTGAALPATGNLTARLSRLAGAGSEARHGRRPAPRGCMASARTPSGQWPPRSQRRTGDRHEARRPSRQGPDTGPARPGDPRRPLARLRMAWSRSPRVSRTGAGGAR